MDERFAIGAGETVPVLLRQRLPEIVQFSLNSISGVSRLRGVSTTANGGTVSESGGEIALASASAKRVCLSAPKRR